ncbi:MAG: hypothetical protein ABI904_05570 [Chloroflexota bacterium]
MPSITPTPTLLAIIIATACATPPPTSTSTSAPTGTPIPTPQTGDLSPNDIKILTVLIAGESSSGYVPDDISYMKAWALLNKHAWDRLQPDKKNWTPFESWKHPERPLLDSMKISGSVPGQITSLLNQYQNAKSGGWKYLNDPQRFASIEATVNRAINSWALYGPKSGADLTNGAVGFTDAGGKCFPKGKCKTIEGPDGKPQLATFNMMGEVYQNAITGEAKIEDWRFNYYAERSGFFSTKTYQFGLNDYSQPVYTFTVFEYQPWPAFTWP